MIERVPTMPECTRVLTPRNYRMGLADREGERLVETRLAHATIDLLPNVIWSAYGARAGIVLIETSDRRSGAGSGDLAHRKARGSWSDRHGSERIH